MNASEQPEQVNDEDLDNEATSAGNNSADNVVQVDDEGIITEESQLDEVREASSAVMRELLVEAQVPAGGLVVLGCSTSEIRGGRIGKFGSAEVGRAVIEGVRPIVVEFGLDLAVQGCEHINRALVVEREYARRERLEEVTVVPALHAGGATSVAAFEAAADPVVVERVHADAGLDIGDTEIAQHVRFVQIPLRLPTKWVGEARATAVRRRPRLIGGERARYSQ